MVQEEVQMPVNQEPNGRILIEREDALVLDRESLSDYILFGLRGSKPEGFFVYRHSSGSFLARGAVGMMAELCMNAGKQPEDLSDGFLTLDAYRDKVPKIWYLPLSQMETMDDYQVYRACISQGSEVLLEFDDITMFVFLGTGSGGPATSFNCDGAFLMAALAEAAEQLAAASEMPYRDVIGDLCSQAKECLQG